MQEYLISECYETGGQYTTGYGKQTTAAGQLQYNVIEISGHYI
jgi:hypothetical protein